MSATHLTAEVSYQGSVVVSSNVVFRNGAVFCADAAGTWANAVAVEDGVIVAVGGDDEIGRYAAHADEVVDLDGRLMLPGFVDAHVHPIQGGLERIRCDLTGGESATDYLTTIAAYAQSHPDRPWILGGGWSMPAFPGGTPTRQALDAVVPDRPVFLPNRDHHSAWVNTRALELAGIDAGTPDPSDGRIEREPDGSPSGALHEGAMDLVGRHVPADTPDDLLEGLAEAQRYLHSVGVVGWQDAMVRHEGRGPGEHAAYLTAQAAGWLTARVEGALWCSRDVTTDTVADYVATLATRREEARVAGGRYRAEHVKVMVDGVVETQTAAMVEPYLDASGCPCGGHGLSFFDAELLRALTTALDAGGFGVHFHALGDRAVRDALDALTAARQLNGTADRRHHLAHLQVVQPGDVPRFRQLGASANIQALWACHEDQMDELAIPFLGPERSRWQYPFGSLLRDGATLAMGSDWPVSTPDPLQAVHVAVNRVAWAGALADPSAAAAYGQPLEAAEAIPLAAALRAYTAGSAWVSRFEDRGGTVAVGKDADLVVLSTNPFELPVDRIGETVVHRTYVGGALVHQAD